MATWLLHPRVSNLNAHGSTPFDVTLLNVLYKHFLYFQIPKLLF